MAENYKGERFNKDQYGRICENIDGKRDREPEVMSNYTYETVPTQLLPAEGVRYGNCRLAMAETVPLEFFGYLTQTAASEVGNV